MPVTVTLRFDVGTVERGLWHDDCQTSGLCRWPVSQLIPGGVVLIGTYEHCLTCEPGQETDA